MTTQHKRTKPTSNETRIDVQYGIWQSLPERPCGRRQIILLPDPSSEGKLTVRTPGAVKKSFTLKGQQALFITRNAACELLLKQEAVVVCLGLPDDFIEEVAPGSAWNKTLLKSWLKAIQSDFYAENLTSLFLELCRGKRVISTQALQGLGFGLADLVLRNSFGKRTFTGGGGLTGEQHQKTMAYYDEHFKKPDFDYESLASYAAGVGFGHYCRLFKRTMRMKPREYLMFKRITYVQQLVREDNARVGEAVFKAGFSQHSQYNEWLRRFRKRGHFIK